MIGYSDSVKDGGYIAANWQLYDAQQRLARLAQEFDVSISFFHGRGGALGRGGGPAAQAVLSLPSASVRGRLRVTEQGEVVAERYGDPVVAYRHLEQLTWATLLVSADVEAPPDPQWVTAWPGRRGGLPGLSAVGGRSGLSRLFPSRHAHRSHRVAADRIAAQSADSAGDARSASRHPVHLRLDAKPAFGHRLLRPGQRPGRLEPTPIGRPSRKCIAAGRSSAP